MGGGDFRARRADQGEPGLVLDLGMELAYSTPEETRAHMEGNIERFKKIVASRNIERQ